MPVNDITLVGDAEAALREATSAVHNLEERGEPDEKALSKARRAVDREQQRLTRFIAAQQVVDPRPLRRPSLPRLLSCRIAGRGRCERFRS